MLAWRLFTLCCDMVLIVVVDNIIYLLLLTTMLYSLGVFALTGSTLLYVCCFDLSLWALSIIVVLFSHRVVEHSCKLMVRDSLNITHTQSSSYQPLYDDDGMFNLDKFVISLEIENKCQVSMIGISCRDHPLVYATFWKDMYRYTSALLCNTYCFFTGYLRQCVSAWN